MGVCSDSRICQGTGAYARAKGQEQRGMADKIQERAMSARNPREKARPAEEGRRIMTSREMVMRKQERR